MSDDEEWATRTGTCLLGTIQAGEKSNVNRGLANVDRRSTFAGAGLWKRGGGMNGTDRERFLVDARTTGGGQEVPFATEMLPMSLALNLDGGFVVHLKELGTAP